MRAPPRAPLSPAAALLAAFGLVIAALLMPLEIDASSYQAHFLPEAVAGNGSTVVEIDVNVGPATVSFACNQPVFSFSPTSVTGTGKVTVGHAGFQGLADLTATIDDGEMVLNKTLVLFIDKPSGDSTASKLLLNKGACSPGGMPPGRYDSIALGHQGIAAAAKVTVRFQLTYTVCPATYNLVSATGHGVCVPQPNECALGIHNCDIHATCTKTHGSFTCACNAGYTGAGTNTTCLCTLVYTVVSTISGTGVAGYADGAGTSATWNAPFDCEVDAAGNVITAGWNDHKIRIVAPNGATSTLAGNGTGGYLDGPGATALVKNPGGVAFDAAGNIFFTDTQNHCIRKIAMPSGVVSTVVGTAVPGGVGGFLNGNGIAAQVKGPRTLTIDKASGTLFICDSSNMRVRKMTPNGDVTTLAGSGTQGYLDGNAANARFNGPIGCAFDAVTGNVFVGGNTDHRIRKVTPLGDVTTLAGSGTLGYLDGAAAVARFNYPSGLHVDAAGNVIVADNGNARIRKITPNGVVSTIAGAGNTHIYVDGSVGTAQFARPLGACADAQGNIYVADQTNNRIRKITATCPMTP